MANRELIFLNGPVWRTGKYYYNASKPRGYCAFAASIARNHMSEPVRVSIRSRSFAPDDPEKLGHKAIGKILRQLQLPMDRFCGRALRVEIAKLDGFLRVACQGVFRESLYSIGLSDETHRLRIVICREMDVHVFGSSARVLSQVKELARKYRLRSLRGTGRDYKFVFVGEPYHQVDRSVDISEEIPV